MTKLHTKKLTTFNANGRQYVKKYYINAFSLDQKQTITYSFQYKS